MSDPSLIRLPPLYYAHVQDTNTTLTTVVEGPCNYVKRDHEAIVSGPAPKIQITPGCFCVVLNPVLIGEDAKVMVNEWGMPKLRHSEREVRTYLTHPQPFLLYPGELLDKAVTPATIVKEGSALKLRALVDFTDVEGTARKAGMLWMRKGPLEYVPRMEEEVVELLEPVLILPNSALKLTAMTDFIQENGVKRRAGQSWLVRDPGHYLPGAYEKVVSEVKSVVITETQALRLQALKPYTDAYGQKRQPGEEWLVTKVMSDSHLPDVNEYVVTIVHATVLNSRQFCFIVNPVKDGVMCFGIKTRRVGPVSFFLEPFEVLEGGIKDVYVLDDQQALLMQATFDHKEGESFIPAGKRWLVHGPCEFIPDVWQTVVEVRKTIPLTENEGIYVRNLTTGEVRSVIGQTYMLQCDEALWEMDLDPMSEKLVQRELTGDDFQVFVATKKEVKRARHMVVSVGVPHNSATQIFDYKTKSSRVVFGPDRVMLGPDERFTVLSLSGGIPKRENDYQSLSLRLGPDFMRDKIVVETLDHARLSLKLSYRWVFELKEKTQAEGNKLFKVRDFIGDTCKSIASRIRGAVAGKTFEVFHMHSSDIIRNAVFRKRRSEDTLSELRFPINNLVITSVDVLSVKPVDKLTKDCLKKSITMAIEITTDQYKMKAEQQSALQKQQAAGLLEMQRVSDQVEAERAFSSLRTLEASSLVIAKSGKMVADASAAAHSRKIELQSELEVAELEVQAEETLEGNERTLLEEEYRNLEEHQQALNELEISKTAKLASIEAGKFRQTVESIGRKTIVEMARAGPETQAKLLKGLGLKGFLVTSGKNPINLFQTANGLIGHPSS